ncbi:MAG: SurA N-terminal domain-containing protein [Chakrabartia sp.]
MISFFRRALSSWAVLGLLGLIMVAFIITGVGTPSGLGNIGGGGSDLASVSGRAVTADEMSKRLDTALKRARQEQPGMNMSNFIREGAFDGILKELIDFTSLEIFAKQHGMAISHKLIGGEIGSISAFNGAAGGFDQARFQQVLSSQGMTEARFRSEVTQSILLRHMLVPVSASAGVQNGIALPYAALALESRSGSIAAVPLSAFSGGAAPTAADIQAFYARNAARYTVPETRAIRYATFDKSRFVGKVLPSEAEIAAYYKKNAATYAARETRSLTQIIVQDQSSAARIATAVRSGTPFDAAAKSAGVDALTLTAMEKSLFAKQSSDAVATAAFAQSKGGVTMPVKSGLGWHVVRVDAISGVAGRPLASVRGDITALLTKQKNDEALSNFVTEIDDAVADGQTFDDIVKAKGLTVVTTPAVTASGIAPEQSGFKAGAELPVILRDAFQAEIDDDPTLVTLSPESFAFYDLDRVVASAPRPLAKIQPQVANDFAADRASRAARKIADTIAARANAGTPFATALSTAGKSLPAPRPINARRIDISRAGQQVPPALTLLFSMAPKKAKVIEMPDNQGWFVIWLDSIQAGQTSDPQLIATTQRELADLVAREYTEQFTAAVQSELKVKRNAAAAAQLKASLLGAGTK